MHGNLKNLASKGVGPPLFGALTMHVVEDDDVVETDAGRHLIGWRSVTVNAGKPVEMFHKLTECPSGPIGVEEPVGRFLLEAFDMEVNLSELLFSAQRAVAYFDTTVKYKLEKAVREGAVAADLDPEAELKKTGLSLVWNLKVRLDMEALPSPDVTDSAEREDG